jgi:putative oxidoreductase
MDLTGRILLATFFALGVAQKLADPGPVETLLTGAHLPTWLIWPAAALNAGGALALALNLWRRPVALTLAAYCAVTSLFHLIPADPWQMSILVKNWAIAGGLLVVAARVR